MRWAVVGSNGMFGADLLGRLLEKRQDAVGFNRANLVLEQHLHVLAQTLADFDVIVNAVGFTKVDEAESNSAEALKVNGEYAGKLAEVASAVGARFIHISTDYVFDGTGITPYKTSDPTNPQNSYGKSKVLGEQLISASGANYSILRAAWLYSAGGRNFAKTIASRLLVERSVRVVRHQIGQPTWTRDLADQVIAVAQLDQMPRIVHAVSSGQGSWADFAREIASSLGMAADSVIEVSTSEFKTVAKRPSFSVLHNSINGLTQIGDWRERWTEAAPIVLAEFLAEKRP
jgi:dTDP-4-dehydrorhamnose reductase